MGISQEDLEWMYYAVDSHKYIRSESTKDRVKILMIGAFTKGLEKAKKETVICSAVLEEDGNPVRGHRHHDCIAAIKTRGRKLKQGSLSVVQGFMTSQNRYVGRKEGLEIQLAAGIKSHDPNKNGGYKCKELYSEDLY